MRSHFAAVLGIVLCLSFLSNAQTLRERLAQRRAQAQNEQLDEDEQGPSQITLPAGAKVAKDVSYGADPLQRLDIYMPQNAHAAPVIFMVHGGGWRRGDKAAASVVQNKMTHWVGEGFVFVSVNNRLLPNADPVQQAEDVAKALAFAQSRAASWGADPAKFILMGHSAGAHLVDLITCDPNIAKNAGVKPWLGTVSLDSGAIDVVAIMQSRHFKLYDDAFGSDPAFWRKASPLDQLSSPPVPMLLVCSSRRKESCPHSQELAAKIAKLGGKATVLPRDMSHREINVELGLPGEYTAAVDSFVKSVASASAGSAR